MEWEFGDKFRIRPEALDMFHQNVNSDTIYTLEYLGDPDYYHFYIKVDDFWMLQCIKRDDIHNQVERVTIELH